MNKLSNIAIIIVTLFFSFSTSSCCSKKKTKNVVVVTPDPPRDYEAEGFWEATVISYEVDGCSWMIKVPSGELLQPLGLPDSFKKNNLAVWVKFTAVKDAMTTCMAGKVVNIVVIELKK